VTRVCIIGIGNTLMGDDGVGVMVAEGLSSRDLGADVSVVVGATDGMALSHHFSDADAVVIVDAIAADDTPGSVYRLTPEDAGITSLRPHSSHGISIPSIIFAAKLQNACPEVVIYAVQIGDILCGFETLSPEVEAAIPEVAEMVVAEALRLAEKPAASCAPE
jgi:hydrogenase maturation protease